MIQKTWEAYVSWGSEIRDLDIYAYLSAGGQSTSGVGWSNGSSTSSITVSTADVEGTFYAIWHGDNTSSGGSEHITIYFRGTKLPATDAEIGRLVVHCNVYGEGGGTAAVSISGAETAYSGTGARYKNRATSGDPWTSVPIIGSGGEDAVKYVITATPDPAAGGSVAGDGIFDPNTTCTLSARAANDGYVLSGWYENGAEVASGATYSFTVTSDRTLVAKFDPACTIKVVADPEGGGTVTGGGTFTSASSCQITAEANDGYEFAGWTSSDGGSSSDEEHTVLVPEVSVPTVVTWTAHFRKVEVWVRCGPGNDCYPWDTVRVDFAGGHDEHNPLQKTALFGETVTFTASTGRPSTWEFVKWTDPDGSTSTSAFRTITVTKADVEAHGTSRGIANDGTHIYTYDFTCEYRPKAYKTFKLRIARGASKGSLGTITWSCVSRFVTVTSSSGALYEARVPDGAQIESGLSIVPSVSDPKYCVLKAVVKKGLTPTTVYPETYWYQGHLMWCDFNRKIGDLVEAVCGNTWGDYPDVIVDSLSGMEGYWGDIEVEYHIGPIPNGKLLYGSSGALLHGSTGFPVHL